jgi:Flp pilus assembly protein TadG
MSTMRLLGRPRARRRDERGVAMAELTMILPVLLATLLVIFDLGRGYHAYISVTNGARDAARVAMLDDSDATSIRNAGENGAQPYVVTVNAGSCDSGSRTVRVTHDYQPILPFVTEFWDGTLVATMKTTCS